jgi:hypothetical protein
MSTDPRDNDILFPLSEDNEGTRKFREKVHNVFNTKNSFPEKKESLKVLISYFKIHEECRFLERKITEDNSWYEIIDNEKVYFKITEYYMTMESDRSSAHTQSVPCNNVDIDKTHNQIQKQSKKHQRADNGLSTCSGGRPNVLIY